MKAVLAAIAAATITAGGAGAYVAAVTPAQFAKLRARVVVLERETTCLRDQWNSTQFTAYAKSTTDGWDTPTGQMTVFVEPSHADGIAGTGYLLVSPEIEGKC